ncbi:MAG: ABC transporter substrate-binding protein [Gemmatimonadales bacterium]
MFAFFLRSPMRLDLLKRGAIGWLALGLLGAGGCAGSDTERGGSIVIAVSQDPDGLFPPTHEGIVAKTIAELLFDRLADRGPDLNTLGDAGFVPRLARSWNWSRDSLAVTFHLDPRARWHDGPPLLASDVRFAFAVFTDPVVGARSGGDLAAALDSISVTDSLTCTAWFKQRTPEQFNTLVTNLTPLPEHLLGRVPHDSLRTSPFVSSPVGSGPFRFVRWDRRQRVEVAANTAFYRGRPKLDRVIWTIAPNMTTVVQQLFAGEADLMDQLSVADAASAVKQKDLAVVVRGDYDYAFVQFNFFDGASERPNPLFADRAMRRALTMALDRGAMVRSAFGSMGHVALGPVAIAQWSSDTTMAQIHFDRAAAARTLDSLGWRAAADGMRARNGKPLAFSLLVPSSSVNRQRFAVLIQEQLRQVGVKMDIDVLDNNAMGERFRARRFDAVFGGLVPTPSPSGIRQSWTSAAANPGGFNQGRFRNPAFDAQVDSAVVARDQLTARRHYRAAYQLAIDEAPAIWVYEPPRFMGVNKRLHLTALRPDGWWLGLPEWTVASGSRVPRDTATAKTP